MRYYFVIAFAIIIASMCRASTEEETLAGTLFDRSVAVRAHPTIEMFVSNTVRARNLPKKGEEIYRKGMYEILRSPEYREAYIRICKEKFTVEELRLLVQVSEHPGFKVYIEKAEFIDDGLSPVYSGLLKKKMPEIQKRLADAGIK